MSARARRGEDHDPLTAHPSLTIHRHRECLPPQQALHPVRKGPVVLRWRELPLEPGLRADDANMRPVRSRHLCR
jgi:hypothetical protein